MRMVQRDIEKARMDLLEIQCYWRNRYATIQDVVERET